MKLCYSLKMWFIKYVECKYCDRSVAVWFNAINYILLNIN